MGGGHFTTLQVRDGAMQGLDLHLARLQHANRELFGTGLDVDALRGRIRDRLVEAGAACTLRIAIREPGRPGLEIEAPRFVPDAPLRVRSQPGLRSRPALKHLDLEPQLQARRAARDAGFDDALFVDADGRVAEGTFWNIALWDGSGVVWPEAPMLDGTTQRLLQVALREAGVPQQRAPVPLDGLDRMRAAFALNSTGVQEIARVDGCRFEGDAGASSLLRLLLAGSPWQRP